MSKQKQASKKPQQTISATAAAPDKEQAKAEEQVKGRVTLSGGETKPTPVSSLPVTDEQVGEQAQDVEVKEGTMPPIEDNAAKLDSAEAGLADELKQQEDEDEKVLRQAKERYDFCEGVKLAQEGQPLPEGASESMQNGHKVVDPETKLRLDGPTVEEYVAAGYPADKYPPQGYAVVKRVAAVPANPTSPVGPLGKPIEYKPLSFVHGSYKSRSLIG